MLHQVISELCESCKCKVGAHLTATTVVGATADTLTAIKVDSAPTIPATPGIGAITKIYAGAAATPTKTGATTGAGAGATKKRRRRHRTGAEVVERKMPNYRKLTSENYHHITHYCDQPGDISFISGMCESTTTPGCIVGCDSSNRCILEIALDRSKPPRVIAQFQNKVYPEGIACCDDGTQDYVVSCGDSITRISGDGIVKWRTDTKGVGLGKFGDLAGIVVLPNGQTVVADSQNGRLQVLDALTGRFIKTIQVPGRANPAGLAYDNASGLLFVTLKEDVVQVHEANDILVMDITTGTIVRTIKEDPEDFSRDIHHDEFPRIRLLGSDSFGVALDNYGNLLVVGERGEIAVFNATTGNWVADFSSHLESWHQYYQPNKWSIYIDKKTDYVVVSERTRLCIFKW